MVQRNSLDQLHGQHSGARELLDHLWNLEEVVTFQQASEGKWRWALERRRDPGRGILLHTPEPLGTFCLPLVVALPGQLSLENLQAAICKQTCEDGRKNKNRNFGYETEIEFSQGLFWNPQRATWSSPSGRITLIFRTDMRLLISLWMLSATPGYCQDPQQAHHQLMCTHRNGGGRSRARADTWILRAISRPSFNTP